MNRDSRAFELGGLSRRDLLRGGMGIIAISVTGCVSDEPESEPTNGDIAEKEAPTLAAQVKAGELPPLEERLPREPLVIQPVDRLGQYGGTWNAATLGPADSSWLYLTTGYDQLLSWDLAFTQTVPNVATSVEPNQDGSEWTVTLREGMKWSDGEPFTADDIVFAVEDVFKNEQLFPAAPAWLTVGGSPGTVSKVDDQTAVFMFGGPYGLFRELLATPGTVQLLWMPRHYLEEFHADHNPDADSLAQQEGAADWVELISQKFTLPANPDLPVLNAWRLTTPYGEGTRVVTERNPYYWKTDPKGRQLPYLDSVVFDVIGDAETMLLRATNGEIDMQDRHIAALANKPVLARSREEGDYDFIDETPTWNQMMVALNLTHENPALREVFQNKDFRIGLSYAINRQEIIDLVYQQQGEPWQLAPTQDSDFHLDGFGEQYTEYDVDMANEHLDRAGYTTKDSDGVRLRPDGDRIEFVVEVSTANPEWADALELIRGYWREVGIEIRVLPEDRSLYTERRLANKPDAMVGRGDGCGHDAILELRNYFPFNNATLYAILWVNWYNGAEPNEEPPEPAKQQMALYDQIKSTIDEAERTRLFMELLEIAQDQFWAMGIAIVPGYGIVKNTFHNVPTSMPASAIYPTPGPSRPEQYFTTEA